MVVEGVVDVMGVVLVGALGVVTVVACGATLGVAAGSSVTGGGEAGCSTCGGTGAAP